ncbi:hypothetical protein C1H46_020352 [Malus baccata]|uniref:Protein kinase domain-containing protein n=1 Tax=Malus baccata TaxID=106549 RepID=A0A540M684_MALBA|nr:hypothetical protein C1H46_020352 [Malus baccata]
MKTLLIAQFLLLLLGLALPLTNSKAISHENFHRKLGSAANAPCPLKINLIQKLITQNDIPLPLLDIATKCQYVLQGIRLLRSDYLRTTGLFSLSPDVLDACWVSYLNLVDRFIPGFDIKSKCGLKTNFMSQTCKNISTKSDFETLVSGDELQQMKGSCDQSLRKNSGCNSCVDRLSRVRTSYFRVSNDGNVSDCNGYPFIYAAAFSNRFGPTDVGTAKCLFLLDFSPSNKKSGDPKPVMWGIVTGSFYGFIGALVVVWFLWIWNKKWKRKNKENLAQIEEGSSGEMEISGRISTSSIKFSFEEIQKATRNFARENIIGMGGYGNVYKGMLQDGSEVALKRFKNCSAAGDQVFTHEVEVIASVRHVNLVSLRGYYWAWSQVREGRVLDVIDECMPELGPPEVMEKYALVAVLASHPVANARPSMDQIVKILENDIPIPTIPDRPLLL